MGKQPNPWQRLVRGTIRELINGVNNAKPKSSQPKRKKSKKVSKTKTQKRSRYIPPSVKVDVLKRDNYRCVYCGITSKNAELQVDHIIPFAKGGSNEFSNLQTLCKECNQGKSDRIL